NCGKRRRTCASVSRSSPPEDLRRKTILQTVNKSRALSKLDLRRRPPLARTRTLPNSRVQSVAMRLVSLQSVVRSTRAVAFSAAMGRPPKPTGCNPWASLILRRDVGQSQFSQVTPLALAHLFRAGRRPIVEATQVQQPVNHVERQLRLDVVPARRGLLL